MNNAMVRVCVVGSGWRFTSGISYYTCRLTGALAGRFQTSALLMRRLIPARLYPGHARVGVPVNEIDYPPDVDVFDGVDWFWVPSMVRAVRFLRRQRPEVVVFQWWTGAVLHSYLVLAFVARRLGARIVIEFHEIQDTGEAQLRGVARYTRTLSTWLMRRADAFVVHSEHDRVAVGETYPAVRAGTTVLPHGPFDHYVQTGSETRSDDEGPSRTPTENDVTVLFFGTIRPYKGLEHLVAAFDRLPDDAAGRLRLLIVGETWEGWSAPVDAARSSRHRDRIEIVNRYVTDREVGEFFRRADAVVLPYLRSSASGPLHIAMAQGLPVVLSDVGGLRDGAAGYDGITWVRPGEVDDLVAALSALPAERGARFADPRSWAATAQAYADIIAELVNG